MSTNLQQLVEGAARRLDRSVAIDDSRMQLVAYSAHRAGADSMRTVSILQRAVPSDVASYIHSYVREPDGLFVVPAHADMGIDDDRFGLPIRYGGVSCGFVWLLASEGPLGDAQLAELSQLADTAGAEMYRAQMHAGADRDREQRLVSKLLNGTESQIRTSAKRLADEGLFKPVSFAALVVEVNPSASLTTDDEQIALSAAVEMMRGIRRPHDLLVLERRNHAVLLVADAVGPPDRPRVVEFGTALRERVVSQGGSEQTRVGIGRTYGDVNDARRSSEEAWLALRMGRRLAEQAPVALIEGLGVYELLSKLSNDVLRAAVHPGLHRLAAEGAAAGSLLATIDRFLGNAGNVKATSEDLFIHRTSLYYRLRQFQDATGLDLSRGEDVLTVQLGLKILRMLDESHSTDT